MSFAMCLQNMRAEEVREGCEATDLRLGPAGESRWNKRVLSAAMSQARRLAQHGIVRRQHGYDTDDGWLVETAAEPMRPGCPCQIAGDTSEQLCVYIGDTSPGKRQLRSMGDPQTMVRDASQVLPLPTQPIQPGCCALVVDLPGQEHLYGRKGMPTYRVQDGEAFAVMFEPTGKSGMPEVHTIPSKNLIGIPLRETSITPFERALASTSAAALTELPIDVPSIACEEDDHSDTHSATLSSVTADENHEMQAAVAPGCATKVRRRIRGKTRLQVDAGRQEDLGSLSKAPRAARKASRTSTA